MQFPRPTQGQTRLPVCDFQNQLRQNGCVEDGRVARSEKGVPVVDAKLRAIASGGVRLIVCTSDGRRRDSAVAASIHVTHGPHTLWMPRHTGTLVALKHILGMT